MYYNSHVKKSQKPLKTKICIVEDHILLRDGLIKVINEFPDCEVVSRATNGLEMMEQFTVTTLPDIVVLDINMPFMDGYDTARWILSNHPAIHIMVLSMFDSEISLIRFLRMGVKAFLKKDAYPNELKYALKMIHREGYYYPQTISGKLANVFHHPDKSVYTHPLILSENEITFLRLTSTELTYKEIAREMFISPRTIDNYRDQLFEKLHIKSRVGLAMYAMKNGIVNF